MQAINPVLVRKASCKTAALLRAIASAAFGLSLAAPVSAATDAGEVCLNCHKDPRLRVTNRPLYEYYQDWTKSKHKEAGVSCIHCHGGDATADAMDKEKAHRGVFLPSNAESRVYYRNLPETCGQCHENVLNHFTASKHYRRLQKDDDAPHCATCHGSMNARVDQQLVNPSCGTCHDREALPDVLTDARIILRNLKIAKAYLGWTTLYYDEIGQDEKMVPLRKQYQRIADAWHRFRLTETEKDSADLLAALEASFRQAWQERKPGVLPP